MKLTANYDVTPKQKISIEIVATDYNKMEEKTLLFFDFIPGTKDTLTLKYVEVSPSTATRWVDNTTNAMRDHYTRMKRIVLPKTSVIEIS